MTARILVIDDEDAIRDRIVRMLSFEGFDAVGAADGKTGVEMAWREPPDLVICDLMMPGINGFGACRGLCDDERTRHVPVIVVSALSAPSDRERAMELGARAYVTKPFRTQQLLSIIRDCLGMRLDDARTAPGA